MEQLQAVRLINDRYSLETLIGQGGMGAVYHGYDTLLERPVAVISQHIYARQDARRALELFPYCGAKRYKSTVERFLERLPA